MNYEEICRQTIVAVEKAGEYVMEQLRNKNRHVTEKGEHNFVTNIDKQSEEILVEELKKIVPGAGFIAEEGSGGTAAEEYNWIIDPIDGTTNFIHGVYPFAISVALAQNLKPVVGIILELGRNECFYAWKDGGAYMDGEPIRVSTAESMQQSLIALGFPYVKDERLPRFMKSVDWMLRNTHGVRRLGSAATDIAWVACGRYDGFCEFGLSPWDIAAGVVILEEAGGKTADFSGGDAYLFNEEVICSNGKNHEEFVQIVGSFMKGE